jgi:hypothetical protein
VFANGVELDASAIVFQANGTGTRQIARIAIKATEMRSTYTIALYDDATGEAVSQVIETSVEALCLKNINAGSNVELSTALMRYGDAVYAFANPNA